MKKLLIVAALAVACLTTAAPRATAQTSSFTFTGVPITSLNLGDSFTVSVFLNFTAGGTLQNLNGLSFWIAQYSGSGFPFSLTGRNIGASIFTDLQTSNFNLQLPNIINPINQHSSGPNPQMNTDLGALSGPPVGNGTYFVADLTFQVTSAGSGVYTLGSSNQSIPNVGGRFSVVTDSNGNTSPISPSSFNVTIVPEPSTFALLGFGLVSAGAAVYRRRSAKA
ncbi:MAG: PEP-CTERM sorting domain-containing protein [Chthoniobacterales bacterium]